MIVLNLYEYKLRFKLFDKAIIIFLIILNVLLLTFHWNLPDWQSFFIKQSILILLIFLGILLADKSKNKILKFLRCWYPVFSYPFLYLNVGNFLHLIFPHEFDSYIIAYEMSVLGNLPNLWVQQYVNPVLTEIMQISYGIYWFTIPIGAAILYFRQRLKEYEFLIFYVTLTFIISYFFFIFFPVAGPRFTLADQIAVSYKGLFLADFLRSFVAQAGYRGGAFPSSHVAVSVVILLFLLKFNPEIAVRFLLPAVLALSLATVYGQYHYLTDMVAGLFLGLIIGKVGVWHYLYQSKTK